MLRRWRLADEHALQLLVEALHTAAQSRDEGRERRHWDGHRLRLRNQNIHLILASKLAKVKIKASLKRGF